MTKDFKRLLSLIAVMCMAFSLAGCEKKAEIPNDYDYADLSEYVKLGEYKGIEYTKITGDVSDEEVKAYVDQQVESSVETTQVKEGKVEKDSVVNIDYVGSMDGTEFEGGAAQGVDLDIANSGYIEGFAEGIIGHEVGETFDLKVTFPEDYPAENLAGKPAVFKTTINYLVEQKKPKYNDEWVKKNSEYKTTKEYEEFVKNSLSEQKLSTAERDEKSEVFIKIIEGSEILKYPEKELEDRKAKVKDIYQEQADQYGMSLDDFVSNQLQLDNATFNTRVEDAAKESVAQELIMHAIKEAEDIKVSKDGYAAFLDEMLKNSGMTEETFKEQRGMTFAEYANDNNLFGSYLYSEVMNKVMEYSVGK